MTPPLVELALEYYHNPLAYGHLADGSFPLPRGFTEAFSALCSALSPLHIDATARALDTTPTELEAAARFFARHVLLDPAANYYRALGVSPRVSRTPIREHYLFLIKLFHPDRLPDATETDLACSRRLNAAYHLLSDPDQRAGYDREQFRGKQRIRYSDPRDFFGPHRVPMQVADTESPALLPRRPWLWAIALGAGCALLAAVALWVFKPTHPLRAAEQPKTAPEPPRPYYLRASAKPERTAAATASPTTSPAIRIAAMPEDRSDPRPHCRLGTQPG